MPTADSRTTIVTAIDVGTDPAVARAAGELAKVLDSTLLVAHVVEDPPLGESHAERERNRHAALRHGRENLHWVPRELPAGVEVRERVVLGSPAEELIAIAAEEEAALLVAGCRGRGPLASALMGSVSRALVREAPCPVVILTPEAVKHRPLRAGATASPGSAQRSSVVIGIDGSSRSVETVRLARELADRLRARLVLVHALDAPAGLLTSTEAEAAAAAVGILTSIDAEGEIRVEWGSASLALESVAWEEGAQLIVLGTRDIGALRAAALGSVTSELLRFTRHPLVVLPERARRETPSRERAA
jgi:nucleotide-binding universal stress UspA family protein